MPGRRKIQFTEVEEEVISAIRERRALPPGDPAREPVDDPAALMWYFIEGRHGSVRLRVGAIAREIGLELRPIERSFVNRYGISLREYQVAVRLKFAVFLLGFYPETRIKEVACELGYTAIRDFNRFFKEHMHMSPTEWLHREKLSPESNPRLIAPGNSPPEE